MKRLLLIVTALVTLVNGELLGDAGKAVTDSIPLYRMKEIVVTARHVPTLVEELALSVSVIGEREIQTTLSNSSTDLSGVLPGVFIERTGDFGRSDVSIRGLGSRGRYSLVLVDGRPEKMALFDCTVTHSFPLHDVERIEVIRGTSSMLHGSGAIGGVMNVIPRRVRNDIEIDLSAGGGSYDTWVTNGRFGGRRGRFSGALSVDYRESNGHIGHSGYEGIDIHAGCDIDLSDWFTLSVSGKHFDGYKEEPIRFTDNPATLSDTWNDYKRGSFDIHMKGERDGYSTNVRYYRNFGEHTFSDGWHSKDATDGVMFYASTSPVNDLKLNFGADYRYQQGKLLDTDGAEWNKWETGAYLEATYSPIDEVTLSTGARHNYDKVAGTGMSPSFGVVWQPAGGSTIRALASHGFRSPQLNELYMFPPSNDALKAEKVWNYELGLRQELPWQILLDIAAFRMDGTDMIELAPNSSPPPLYVYSNTGEFEFYGIETSLSGKWKNGFEGRTSYSWLDPGDWTRGRPGRKYDLMIGYSSRRLTIRMNGQLVSDYYAGNEHSNPIDSYVVIDLYGESTVGTGARVFAGINNLFDKVYTVYVDLPGGAAGLYEMPGTTFITGLKYTY
ncbi:MAG: TonB-dependent receptor [bacterium]|nr:MAG: TonB-dependent receptor [bacterium]